MDSSDQRARVILAGDVGGTKVRLALFPAELFGEERALAHLSCDCSLALERYESRSAASLEEIIARFLERHGTGREISAFCVGAPGPVLNGIIKTTNLPWEISTQSLAAALGTRCGALVNDLVATIAAVPVLTDHDCRKIYEGLPTREKTVYAIVAPGTGLGQAFMVQDDRGRMHPYPSEGGHVEFAPKNNLEFELLKYLQQRKQKRISIERVVSGPGLVNIYHFLRDTGRAEEPAVLRDEIGEGDAAPLISKHGLSDTYPICVQALEIFIRALGSHAGDVALSLIATGGIYLGGGIPPRILSKLASDLFVSAYLDKGRLAGIVKATPVTVITDDRAALLGAASIAAAQSGSGI